VLPKTPEHEPSVDIEVFDAAVRYQRSDLTVVLLASLCRRAKHAACCARTPAVESTMR